MEDLDQSLAQSKYSTDPNNSYFLGAPFPTSVPSSQYLCPDAHIEARQALLIIFPIKFPRNTWQMLAQSLLGCHELGAQGSHG